LANRVPLKLPAIIGLDGAGTIVSVGSVVAGYKVGDRVIVKRPISDKGTHAEWPWSKQVAACESASCWHPIAIEPLVVAIDLATGAMPLVSKEVLQVARDILSILSRSSWAFMDEVSFGAHEHA
jgi:hypothetical protein